MLTPTKVKQVYSSSSISWNPSTKVESYSDDDLINAYLKGKDAQKNETQRILTDRLKCNVEKATKLIDKFYQDVERELKVEIKSIRLKINGIENLYFLFVVDNKSFINESFLRVYDKSKKLRDSIKNEMSISISFMPYKETIDNDIIISDGYKLEYGNIKK